MGDTLAVSAQPWTFYIGAWAAFLVVILVGTVLARMGFLVFRLPGAARGSRR